MSPNTSRSMRGSTRGIAWVLALFLALLAALPARADWQQFPETDVSDLFEAPDGRLWVATGAAARVFDGKSWGTVVPPRGGKVRRVLVDRAGALWLVTELHGVARFDGTAWNLPGNFAEAVPDSQGRDIFEDQRGDIWIAYVKGLAWYQRDRNHWEWLDTGNSGLIYNAINDILEDTEGSLWFAFGLPGGLSVLDSTRTPGGWRREEVRPGGLPRDSVFALGLGGDGSVWCGSYSGASRRRPDGTWRHFTQHDGLPSDSISVIVSDKRSGAWFAASGSSAYSPYKGGVGRYDGSSFRVERLRPTGELIGPIRSLLRDSGGVLWCGIGGGALLRSDEVEWRNFVPETPGSCTSVSTLASRTQKLFPKSCELQQLEDRVGNLWLASDIFHVAVLDTTGRWGRLEPRSAGRPFADSVRVLVEGSDGVLHFGSRQSGVISFDRVANAVVAATRTEGLTGDTVSALFEDAAHELWAGSPFGLARRRGGVWAPVPELEGRSIGQIVEDGDRALWIWAGSELFLVSPARDVVRSIVPAGLASSTSTPLCRRADGSVWVALEDGLYRIEADTLVAVPGPADAKIGTSIEYVSEDRAGGLWIASYAGAARLEGAQWVEYSALPSPLAGSPSGTPYLDTNGVTWIPTGNGVNRFRGDRWLSTMKMAEGLVSNTVRQIHEDRRGRLWFLSKCGATEHAPDRAAPQTVVDLAPLALSPVRDATFAYSYFGDEESVDFSTRLDPALDAAPEAGWSGWSTAGSQVETGLVDGEHRFEVRARDASGNIDPIPAAVIWDVDATPPPARIDAPANRAVVDSLVSIVGTTADPRLRQWRLDVKPAAGAWETDSTGLAPWTTVGQLADTLATWDSHTVPDGEYDLRVVTQDSLGLEAIGEVRVLVDNVAPFADVTSPRDVTRQDGGDVFTAEGDARLYLQPGALDRDARVTLVAAAAPPSTTPPLPSGVGVVRRWYEVAWTGATLLKPATLDLTPAGPAAKLAVHRYRPEDGWTRLGGTPIDSTGLTLAIDRDAGYAVVEETAVAPEGAFTVAALRFSPRLFSPGRGGASGALSIAFDLGRAATVDVRVHNRAGRLVNEVARGSFAAGTNLVTWDGRDRSGTTVPAGLYVVTVEALGDRLQNTIVVSP